MLRASIEHSGQDASLRGIAEGAKAGDVGIEFGERLVAFADAAVQRDDAALDTARDALREAAGGAMVVDAAAVIGNFQRMVRIADGTGIPLDSVVDAMAGDLQSELGIDEFAGGRSTPSRRLARFLGTMARPFVHAALRIAGRRARNR